MNKKVLITGGAGFLGSTWAQKISSTFETHITYNKTDTNYFFVNKHQVNLEDKSQITELFHTIKPDIIINTVGLTSVDECEKNPDKAFQVNVQISIDLASEASQIGARFLHISSDHLFSDQKALISEVEAATPQNKYAETKLLAEEGVLSRMPDALIIRTNFYGNSEAQKASYTDWIIENALKDEKLPIHEDIYFSPVWIDDLIEYGHKLLDLNLSGIFNVTSSKTVSKYDFSTELLDVLGIDSSIIERVNLKSHPKDIKRPSMMALDNSKLAKALGSVPRAVADGFRAIKSQRDERKIINYGKHFIDAEDINAVVEVLKNGYLTQGPKVEEFEDKIARYTGAKYCVAVSTWTSGIHMACLVAGLDASNCLITTPMTFCASSNGALYCQSTPLFADVDPETLNISTDKLEEILEDRSDVKAIMPVHFAGYPAEMEKVHEIAKKFNVLVIEDAAHALGARYRDGSLVGNCKYSDMTGFSFHPVKNIATGEGGAITTNSEDIYRRLLRLRSHGINKSEDCVIDSEALTNGKPNQWYHEMQELGFNYRITDIQCALGMSQLNKLDIFMERRKYIANLYDEVFSNLKNAKIVHKGLREVSGNHIYILRINYEKLGKTRYEVIEELKAEQVQGHVHYIPVPLHPYYRDNFNIDESCYREALRYYREALTIPLFPAMNESDIKKVISVVKKVLGS